MTTVADLPARRLGVFDVDEATYHGDRTTLSVSGAKKLLPPSCPAIFKWERDNPPPPKDAFDLGTTVHTMILGTGAEVERIDADSWRTKAAKDARDAARDAGKVPLLVADADRAQAMADKVLTHPVASAILAEGEPEQSIYWTDEATGVPCRGRIDWLRSNAVIDVKSASAADPDGFARAAANFRYHQQAAWYSDGVAALGLGDLPFLFIVVSTTPPHPIGIYQLDEEALAVGQDLNRRALDIYAACVERDEWPEWSDDIQLLSLPGWAR